MRMLVVVLICGGPVAASTPSAWDASEAAAVVACLKASDLDAAKVRGRPLVLDDSAGKTAVLVRGRWKPAHMKGARATMLCLYDRAGQTAAVTEARGWTAR